MEKRKENSALRILTMLFKGIFDNNRSFNKKQKRLFWIITNDRNSISNISENFWEIRLDENQLLEIEFLERLEDVEICLQDKQGNTVYELQASTAPTFHVIIDIRNWIPGLYSIQIKNSVEKEKNVLYWFRTTSFLFLKNHLFKESELRLFAD